MKNVIYQYWDGKVRQSVHAGVAAMKKYADYVGADYVFEDNPNWLRSKVGADFGGYSPHYGAFKPLWSKKYREYDNILFCDTDISQLMGLLITYLRSLMANSESAKSYGNRYKGLEPKVESLRRKTTYGQRLSKKHTDLLSQEPKMDLSAYSIRE